MDTTGMKDQKKDIHTHIGGMKANRMLYFYG